MYLGLLRRIEGLRIELVLGLAVIERIPINQEIIRFGKHNK